MKKIIFVTMILMSGMAFGQVLNTARDVAVEASRKSSVNESVDFMKKNSAKLPVAERRALLTFLADVLEQSGDFLSAEKTYATAAGLQGGEVKGMANRTSEQLVIDAIRCALSAGDYSTAESYLNSAVKNSKDEKVLAYTKLYSQWCVLCKAESAADIQEPVAILKAYCQLDSMKTVQPQILLTLWHLTGESEYSSELKKKFPKSMECAIVKGEIQNLPTPFWYFVPRKGMDLPEIAQDVVHTEVAAANSDTVESSESEKAIRQQLGLFREEANANSLVDKLKLKGFAAKIMGEIRPSGTKYYLVVVDENKAGTIGDELRTAGFECYPLFK